MARNTYTIFDIPEPISKLERWTGLASKFDQIIGFTFFGDFFLRNSETKQFAILYTIDPELVPLEIDKLDLFEEQYLLHATPQETLLKPERIAAIERRIGKLAANQVYIPEPYPFLGGDCSVESYSKGDVWVYAELVGSMQGV